VKDDQAPIVDAGTCPGAITVNTSTGNPANCAQKVNWTPPTATDNCGQVEVSSNHNPGETFHDGTTLVTYTF